MTPHSESACNARREMRNERQIESKMDKNEEVTNENASQSATNADELNDQTPPKLFSSTTLANSPRRRLIPMPQHLAKRIIPLCNKRIRELIDLLGRRRMAAPHSLLRGLVSGVIWDELTTLCKTPPSRKAGDKTYSFCTLLRTSQHKFHERFDAGSV
jgi:hypothetical protein